MTFIAVRCPHCQSDHIVKRVAEAMHTILYEVISGLGVRVQRIFVQHWEGKGATLCSDIFSGAFSSPCWRCSPSRCSSFS